MNRLLLSIALIFAALTVQGKKTRTIERPVWLSSDAGKSLTVTRIEFTDTATVVSFHSEYIPKYWIRIASTSTLTGDDGKRYAIRHGIGITPGEKFNMPESGKADFKIAFEPMPRSTRFIDFTEGVNRGWCIWAIHEQGTRMPKALKSKGDDLRITDESKFFKSGTGVVRGRFTGRPPKMLTYYGDDGMTQENRPQVFDVNDDGTFTVPIPVNLPTISYLSDVNNIYYFKVAAGDTLDITINADGKVIYPETFEYARLMNLLGTTNATSLLDYKDVKAAADKKTPAELNRWMCDEHDKQLTFLDYIAARNGLSPRETQLMKLDALMSNLYLFYNFIDKPKDPESYKPENYTFTRRLPADDLSYLMLTNKTDGLLNSYEFSNIIYRMYENGKLAPATDSAAIAADKQLFGGEHPSRLLQMTWLNKRSNQTDYKRNAKKALETMAERRKMMTSSYIRSVLDRIKDELTAPKTTAYTLPEGKATDVLRTITDKYRGKFVIIDFWGISCGPCRANIERTQQLRDSITSKMPEVEMVFITCDRYSPIDKYNDYVEKHLRNVVSYRLPLDDYRRLMGLFRFNGIPHYEMLAPDGRVVNIENDFLHTDFKGFKEFIKNIKEGL